MTNPQRDAEDRRLAEKYDLEVTEVRQVRLTGGDLRRYKAFKGVRTIDQANAAVKRLDAEDKAAAEVEAEDRRQQVRETRGS